MKCVQVGISEWLVVFTFSQASRGRRVFYVLPTVELRNIFVADRVERPMKTIRAYRDIISGSKEQKVEGILEVDNRGLKTWGDHGVMLFVGSNSKVSFLSFSADVVVIDERDKCNQANLAMAPDRYQASELQIWREVGVPTVEGKGIAESFNDFSDAKEWFVKCIHCNEWQFLDFFENVIREVDDQVFQLRDLDWIEVERDVKLFCRKCGKEINRLSDGEWIHKFEGRDTSGYHVSEQMFANTKIANMWKAFLEALQNESKMQRFMNSLLGLPYVSAGAKLTLAILDECVELGEKYRMPSKAKKATMGVDVGKVLNVTICDHPRKEKFRRPVFIGTVRDFSELHSLIDRFGVTVCVVDSLPETRKAKEFAKEARCAVWLCEYVTERIVDMNLKKDPDDPKINIVQVDRTQSLDGLVADFNRGEVVLPANASTLDGGDVFRQLGVPTRVYREERNAFVWDSGNKADHYFHSFNYEKIAVNLLGKIPKPQIRVIE